jgi:TolB-like protein/class 3 adenylate cyclase
VGRLSEGILSGERVERRLAAILAADVVGYSSLMGQDEAGTLARLRGHRRELIDPSVIEHKGRIVKTTGDGILIEFPSVVEAVACAVAVQRGMAERNSGAPEDQRILFRVGVNLGDIIVEDDDIFGDGVNVAARLETLAEPGGICVNRVVRDQVRDKLDIAFEDMGEQRVKNIARPVRAFRVVAEAKAEPEPSAPPPALALPDKPSIAVLPFQNMSGDPGQEYFADGMVEEIITALSRIRWLFVIARNSTFTYKGQAIDVKKVGRELGVRYVLEGSVRKAGGRVRITSQLVDAETGAHLWADRFDGSLEDVFELQDRVATSVAGVIEPRLRSAEVHRSIRRPTQDLTAYDLYLRALPNVLTFSREGILNAVHLLEEAIERDPGYGPALGQAANCHMRLCMDSWTENPRLDHDKGIDRARRALECASEDTDTITIAATVLAYFGEDIKTMMALAARALLFNPSFARGWYLTGVLMLWAGKPDAAIEHVTESLRLSPRARVGTQHNVIGYAHLFQRRFNDAVAALLLAIQEHRANPQSYRGLAACYAHLGQLDAARQMIERLKELNASILPEVERYHALQDREVLLSGIRIAVGNTP